MRRERSARLAVVATLGPSTVEASAWEALLDAGATAFRLNTSHLSLPQLEAWLNRLDDFFNTCRARPPLVLDLQGSKWRLGEFPPCEVQMGARLELVLAEAAESPGRLPVPHADFFQAAAFSDSEIVLNDARVRLAVQSYEAERVVAEVIQPGALAARKGITYACGSTRREALSVKDQAILHLTDGMPGLRYALSYLKDAVEMDHYRRLLGAARYLAAKLERREALDEAELVARSADELWLCRGDLGAELGLRPMAAAVHAFTARVGKLPKPCLLAGQVLEHMTGQAAATRSELCYLYDAQAAGYSGVVLSDETAIGRYPVESVRMAALFMAHYGQENLDGDLDECE